MTLIELYILDIYQNKNKFTVNSQLGCMNTRNHNKLRIPFAKLNKTKNSPNVLGIKIYNHLPISIKSSEKLSTFKSKMKSLLLGNVFYNINNFFDFETDHG